MIKKTINSRKINVGSPRQSGHLAMTNARVQIQRQGL